MFVGNFPQSLSQAVLVGIILVGRMIIIIVMIVIIITITIPVTMIVTTRKHVLDK